MSVITISVIVVVLNIFLLAAASLNITVPTKSAKAACNAASAPASANVIPDQAARKITVSFTKNDIENRIKYKVEVLQLSDVGAPDTNVITPVEGISDPGFATKFSPDPVEIPIGKYGRFKAVISYQNLTDTSCVYAENTKQVIEFDLNETGPTSLHCTIDMQANPNNIQVKNADGTVNDNAFTRITYTISGCSNDLYHFWIQKCDGTFYDIYGDAQIIGADPMSTYYDWKPEPADISCSPRIIRIKTFADDGSGTMTGSKDISVSLIGATGGAPGAGSGSTSESDVVTTPSLISKFWRFTGPFYLPNHINGLADLTVIIIDLMVLLIGFFAFIGIIIGGEQYITSGGDTSKVDKAKKTIVYSITGIVVAVLSLVILNIAAKFWQGPS